MLLKCICNITFLNLIDEEIYSNFTNKIADHILDRLNEKNYYYLDQLL